MSFYDSTVGLGMHDRPHPQPQPAAAICCQHCAASRGRIAQLQADLLAALQRLERTNEQLLRLAQLVEQMTHRTIARGRRA